MTLPPDFPPPNPIPRKPWGWIVTAVLAVLAVIVVIGVTRPWESDAAAPPSASPTVSDEPTATPSASVPVDGGPLQATGCIAGNDRSAAALLKAQAESPQTATGAAEFATAFFRFVAQYPTPSGDDIAQAQSVMTSDSEMDLTRLPEFDVGRDVAPPGTNMTITTANGGAYVEPFEESDSRAVVTIAYHWVADGVVVSSVLGAATYELRAKDGVWFVQRPYTPKIDPNDVLQVGSAFTGGC